MREEENILEKATVVSGEITKHELSQELYDEISLHKHSGADITSGTVSNDRLNKASTSAQGIVKLNDATNSAVTTEAATANAVKKAYDLANGKVAPTGTIVAGRVATFNDTTGKVIKDSGFTIATSVPANAKFTDTVYTHPTTAGNKHIPAGGASGQFLKWSADGTATWAADNNTWRGVQDNLTSTATDQSLSANQGKILKDLVDGKANSSHGNHVPTIQTADARKFLRNDNTWQTLPSATTDATGIVQLNDATNSTSTSQAATANAVKKAYDLANSKANASHTHTSSQITDLMIKKVDSATTLAATVDQGWANDSIKTNSIVFGGAYNNHATTDANIVFSSTKGKINVVIDGEFYANEGKNKVYHAGNKPTLTELGAAASSHGTHVSYATATTALTSGGTGAVGTSGNVARQDHTHTLPAYPTSLPANGGNADTVDGKHVNDGVADALWTGTKVTTELNKKANSAGSIGQDFNAKAFNVAGAILPTASGTLDIGSPTKRFRSIYVDEAHLAANTLYIDGVPVIGSSAETIDIKADPDQGIMVRTTGLGATRIASDNNVQITTTGTNADVTLSAGGTGSKVNLTGAQQVNLTATDINLDGQTIIKKNLTVNGDLIVKGSQTVLETQTLAVKDNIIEVNKGQTGQGVSAGMAGVTVNRGDLPAYLMIFDEADDMFKVGMTGQLETIASRPWSDGRFEPKFSKKTAFNKDFGTASGTVAQGNHNHDTAYLGKTATATAATKLATARTINGVAFDGTANITITANPNSHNQASNTITAMTGYAKATASSAISASDSLNTAIGKLEKALDGAATGGHNHDSAYEPKNANIQAHISSAHLALGETSSTAYRGDRGKIAYDHSQVAHAPSNAQKNSDITKAEIEAKLTGTVTSHGHATLTRGSYLTGSNYAGTGATTWAVDATSANTASKVVARDSSGNFSANTVNTNSVSVGAGKVEMKFNTTTQSLEFVFTGTTSTMTDEEIPQVLPAPDQNFEEVMVLPQ